MRQVFGTSQRGELSEAIQGIRAPQFLMLMSNSGDFETNVKDLEAAFPGVPSIGCIGMSYDTGMVEKGVSVVAFSDGVAASANVLENASKMPARDIRRLIGAIDAAGGMAGNTVCIDFCTGNDACVLTTFHSELGKRGIPLVGATVDANKVAANGRVYEDAVAFGVIRNLHGRANAYKENIYHPMGDYRFIASKTDRANYILGVLNGKPAKQVYESILHVSDKEVLTQTFRNPFGKLNGDDTCIISIKDVKGDTLQCYRQVNDSDILVLLELGDYPRIIDDTISKITRDFPRRSAVFSVNCLFRYKLFSQSNYMPSYLRQMASLGNHVGLVGYGEHYNDRFVNQSMTCAVFE